MESFTWIKLLSKNGKILAYNRFRRYCMLEWTLPKKKYCTENKIIYYLDETWVSKLFFQYFFELFSQCSLFNLLLYCHNPGSSSQNCTFFMHFNNDRNTRTIPVSLTTAGSCVFTPSSSLLPWQPQQPACIQLHSPRKNTIRSDVLNYIGLSMFTRRILCFYLLTCYALCRNKEEGEIVPKRNFIGIC